MEREPSERILSASCGREHLLARVFSLFCRTALLASALLSGRTVAQSVLMLVGTGSSATAALYSRWSQEYSKRNPEVQVRYLPTSNEEGLDLIQKGASDFATGEARLTEKQQQEGGLIGLPVSVVGIAVIYNLPDLRQSMRLSGEVLGEIYLGNIKTWNAPQLAKLNPGIILPNMPIRVVTPTGGKGSNYVFTEYLSKVNAKFRSQIGATTSPAWPVGIRAERSPEMIEKVKTTVGSIGFVEFHFAARGLIAQAQMLNVAGKFIAPSIASIRAVCDGAELTGRDEFPSLSNTSGIDAYPIAGFSWIYLRSKPPDAARASAISDFLNWIYTDGHRFANEEKYPMLPPSLLAALRKMVRPALAGKSQEAAYRPR